MPKEIIHDDSLVGEERALALGVNPDNSTPLAVEVGWGRDATVQIATINLQNGDGDKRYTSEYGWFTELNRSMVNRLIQVLRKARDQAYGADE